MSDSGIACSFCFVKARDVALIIRSMSPGVFICSDCVASCVQTIAGALAERATTISLEKEKS